MKKTLLGALAIGLLTLAPLAPSQATSQATDTSTADAPRKNLAIISGYVLDQRSMPKNDVLVEVFSTADTASTNPLAFELTYESLEADGSEKFGDGWYRIQLHYVPGTLSDIKIRYSSLEGVPKQSRFETQEYPKTFTLKGRRQSLDLRPVRMRLVPQASDTDLTFFEVKPNGKKATAKVDEGDDVQATASVKSVNKAVTTVEGTVTFSIRDADGDVVKFPKRATTAQTSVKKNGTATVDLPALVGSTKSCIKKKKKKTCTWSASEVYTVVAKYSGSDDLEGSSSRRTKIKVMAPKGSNRVVAQRPNAWI